MLSCLVWTRGLWVFSLAVCSCPVLHMAGDLFCWPCACVFVLCEHMAFVLVFCVPCTLMLIVLTPPILFPDYWFICPTCLPSLPSSFASFIYIYIYAFSRRFYPKAIQAIHFFISMCIPWELNPWPFGQLRQCSTTEPQEHFIISLCLQSCASSSSNVSCSYLVLSCLALPCPALPCPAKPCHASCPAFPLRGSFSLFVLSIFPIKTHSPASVSPRLILSSTTLTLILYYNTLYYSILL